MPKKGAHLGVHLGLPKLVHVTQEFEHVSSIASGEREWRPVVAEVLPEGVPVASLLGLIAARRLRLLRLGLRRVRGGGGGSCRRGGR